MSKSNIPTLIGDLLVLYWSPIDSRHQVTGACRHVDLSTDTNDRIPGMIAIVGSKPSGFYLMRFTDDWQFITDTWHESVEEAYSQAEFEYVGVTQTWQATDAV